MNTALIVFSIGEVSAALIAIIAALLSMAILIFGINSVYKFVDRKSGRVYGRDGWNSSGNYEKCFDEDRQNNRGAWQLTPQERAELKRYQSK